MLNRRSLIAAAVALAMPATPPALASAAIVTVDDAGAITLRDAVADSNAVTVSLDGATQNWVISDSATALTAGAGCTQATASEVRCAKTGARPTAYLGGGDDTFTAPDDGGWIVYGEAGADGLTGRAGADTFFGGAGADTLTGAGGNDRVDGGTGDDAIDGGPGEDLTTYTSATAPVTVDLTAGTGGQSGEHDALAGIEDVTASGTLTGDDGPNFLTGGGGDDAISGHGGDDTLIGEAGNDTVNGGAGHDRLYGDTAFGDGAGGNDVVNGGDGDGDQVSGGPGDDIVNGGSHDGASDGPDQIDGGPGVDVLDYGDRSRGVEVDLRRAAPQGEPGEGDSATAVEGVNGGAGNDTLIGDDGDNVLRGGRGDDTLRGLGGADTLDGGAGVNVLDCGGSTDTLIAGPQDSRIGCGGPAAPPPGSGQGQSQTLQAAGLVHANRVTVRLLTTTLRLGRDGKLALRVSASAAGRMTIALTHGKATYLRRPVTLKRGVSTLHLQLSASATRTLRKHAMVTLQVSLDTLRATVVVKRAR